MQKGRLPTLNHIARKNEEREDIQRLLAMAHNKEIDCVLVSELTS